MAAAALLRRGLCRTASAAARTPVAARAPATRARWAQRPLATTPATLSPGEDLGSFDYGFSKDRIEKGNVSGAAENRGFTYLLMGANKFIYASAVRIGALKFIATMSATKDVLALASAEFDVSAVEEGQTITVRVRVGSYSSLVFELGALRHVMAREPSLSRRHRTPLPHLHAIDATPSPRRPQHNIHRSSGAGSPFLSDIARPTRSRRAKPCRWTN